MKNIIHILKQYYNEILNNLADKTIQFLDTLAKEKYHYEK